MQQDMKTIEIEPWRNIQKTSVQNIESIKSTNTHQVLKSFPKRRLSLRLFRIAKDTNSTKQLNENSRTVKTINKYSTTIQNRHNTHSQCQIKIEGYSNNFLLKKEIEELKSGDRPFQSMSRTQDIHKIITKIPKLSMKKIEFEKENDNNQKKNYSGLERFKRAVQSRIKRQVVLQKKNSFSSYVEDRKHNRHKFRSIFPNDKKSQSLSQIKLIKSLEQEINCENVGVFKKQISKLSLTDMSNEVKSTNKIKPSNSNILAIKRIKRSLKMQKKNKYQIKRLKTNLYEGLEINVPKKINS